MAAAVVGPRPREVLLRVRLGVPLVQLLAVAATVVSVAVLSGQEAAPDEGSGTGFWVLLLAWTVFLGLLAWAGWGLLTLTWHSTLRWPNAVAVLAETAVLVVVVPLGILAPFLFVAESAFSGI